MRRLMDGDYQINMEIELDRGHGIEATSHCVVIYVVNGHVDEVIAYGLHDVIETDIDWGAGLCDAECVDLLKKHHPEAFEDLPTEELKDIESEAKYEVLSGK